MQEQGNFVIANPAGVKQSIDTLEKIASSGKERPSRNDSDRSVAEILVISIFIIYVLAGLRVRSLRVGYRASGFDRRSPDFLAFMNDYDNMFINFLRPKGQLPFTVRRVRSLPVGYHERTKILSQKRLALGLLAS